MTDARTDETPEVATTEIYVRFAQASGMTGIFEQPFDSVAHAADQFVEDNDAVSALKMGFDSRGRVVGMRDITDDIREALLEKVRSGEAEDCPHPMIEDVFDDLRREVLRDMAEADEHERVERAMLHIM